MKIPSEATFGIGCLLAVVPLALAVLSSGAGGMLVVLVLLIIVPMGLVLMLMGAFEWATGEKGRGVDEEVDDDGRMFSFIGDEEPSSDEFSWEPDVEEVLPWIIVLVLALWFYWLLT